MTQQDVYLGRALVALTLFNLDHPRDHLDDTVLTPSPTLRARMQDGVGGFLMDLVDVPDAVVPYLKKK